MPPSPTRRPSAAAASGRRGASDQPLQGAARCRPLAAHPPVRGLPRRRSCPSRRPSRRLAGYQDSSPTTARPSASRRCPAGPMPYPRRSRRPSPSHRSTLPCGHPARPASAPPSWPARRSSRPPTSHGRAVACPSPSTAPIAPAPWASVPSGAAGWHSSLFAHLREIWTTGEIESCTTAAATCIASSPRTSRSLDPREGPPGDLPRPQGPLPAARHLGRIVGWELTDRHHNVMRFDPHGRLVEIADRHRQKAAANQQGNTIRLGYDTRRPALRDPGRLRADLHHRVLLQPQARAPRRRPPLRPAQEGHGLGDDERDADAPDNRVRVRHRAPAHRRQAPRGHQRRLPGVQLHRGQPSHGDLQLRTTPPAGEGVILGGALAGYRLEGTIEPGGTIRRARLAYDQATGRLTEIGFPTKAQGATTETNDPDASSAWRIAYTNPGNAAPASGATLTMPPTSAGELPLVYTIKDGHTETIEISGAPTIGPTAETPPATATTAELPTSDLLTSFAFEDDGRISSVTGPDGVVSYHHLRGGHRPAGPWKHRVHHLHTGPSRREGRPTRRPVLQSRRRSATTRRTSKVRLSPAHPRTTSPCSSVTRSGEGAFKRRPSRRSARTLPIPQGSRVHTALAVSPTRSRASVIRPVRPPDPARGQARRRRSGQRHPAHLRRRTLAVPARLATSFPSTAAAPPQPSSAMSTATLRACNCARYRRDRPRPVGPAGARASRQDEATWPRSRTPSPSVLSTRLGASSRSAAGRTASGGVETAYSYNARDQVVMLTETKLAGPAAGGTPGASASTPIAYDGAGRPAVTTSPGGIAATTSYDPLGRVASTKVGSAGTRWRAYDAASRVVWTTDGHDGVWRGVYNGHGQLFRRGPAFGRRSFTAPSCGRSARERDRIRLQGQLRQRTTD